MTRQPLPDRRPRIGFDLHHGGIAYRVCAGYGSDLRLAEIFLSTHKTGTDLDALARDAGLLFSLLVQHGCPIETILAALTRDNEGRPAGALGRAIEMAIGEHREAQ
jgi:hypothetical protein